MGNQEILNKINLTLDKKKRWIFNSYIIGGTNILLIKFVKNSSSEFSLV